jgi:hypothetical protein
MFQSLHQYVLRSLFKRLLQVYPFVLTAWLSSSLRDNVQNTETGKPMLSGVTHHLFPYRKCVG